MSGGRYIKQAIISALCDHPDQESYRRRAFSGDNLDKVTEALAATGHKLTKSDFFTPDDDGQYIVDTPGFWRNFEKIADIVQKNGERFEAADFTFQLSENQRRTLLMNAANQDGLKKLFNEAVWKGRFTEMENLWYKVTPVPSRRAAFNTDGTLPLDLKRRMYALENRTAPEDRLLRAGLTPHDIRAAFRERGNFENVNTRLAHAGDYLRKEYLLIPDHVGDTVFCAPEAWNRYPELSQKMAARGEFLEVSDFIRQIGTQANVLMRAAEARALDKVFAPELWTDRLSSMLDLWSHVLEGWKTSPMTSKNFDLAYAQAESLTYGKLLDMETVRAKLDLLRPLNDDAAHPVIGLGLKSYWDNAAEIQKRLKAENSGITLADLRRPSGQMGNSCLLSAVKFGHFRTVVEISRSSNQPLTVDDFLSKDRHGNTMLSLLAERSELSLAFAPDLWIGRLQDMKQLWTHVRHAERGQVDFQKAEVAAKQATLKQKSQGKFKL